MAWYCGGLAAASARGKGRVERSSAMDFNWARHELEEPGADLIEVQDFRSSLEFRGGFGHAIDSAGNAVLGDGLMAVVAKEAQAFGAVAPHAGKQYSDDRTRPK